MHHDHRGRLGVCLVMAALAACEQTPTEAELEKAATRATSATPLFLVPPAAAEVPVEGQLWAPLRMGATWPGAPITELGAPVEFAPLTCGGEQHLVEPVARQGQLGLVLPVGRSFRGDAIVGLATVPVPVRTPEGQSMVSQHAKLCLHVRRGLYEEPVASPVVRHRFGFELEVVPLVDPLALNAGDELPLRVHYAGQARAGLEVVVDRQRDDGQAREVFRGHTSPSGHVVVRLESTGLWLVRVRHDAPGDNGGLPRILLATLVFRIGGGQ